MNRALSAVFHCGGEFSPARSVDEMWIVRKSWGKRKFGLDWAQSAADRNAGFIQLNPVFLRGQRDYS